MDEAREYCVYCHISPSNKKYVGISNNPIKRWNNGKGYIKNYLFYRAISKYEWDNFQHLILYENLTLEEAGKIEKELIATWQLTDPQYGYNLREGGNGKLSEYSKYLMSKSRKGNINAQGQFHSLENRRQISESLKRYYASHPVPKLDSSNNLYIQEAEKKRAQYIHERRSAATRGANNPSARAIKQYDLNGNFIARYSYAKAAAEKYNIDLSGIIKCCKGKQKTSGGYKWEYDADK